MLYAILVVLILLSAGMLFSGWSISYDLNRFQDLNTRKQEELIKRIEQVANRTGEAAQRVIDNQKALDSQLVEASEVALYQNTFVDSQLKMLSALVTSDMKAARRDELTRTKELKVALERIVTLTTMARQQPDVMYITAIESATSRIEELENILEVNV